MCLSWNPQGYLSVLGLVGCLTHTLLSGGNIFKGGRTSRSPEGGTSPTYCLDTVRTSLPLVRCVMDALTMSPTPAVVRGARDLHEDLARRRFRHRGVVYHAKYVRRRRVAVLVLDCGLHRPAKMSGPQKWGQKNKMNGPRYLRSKRARAASGVEARRRFLGSYLVEEPR